MVVSTHPSNTRRTTVPPKPKGADTATWLTRNEAADLLNVGHPTLLQFERRDLLHPRRVIRFDESGHERPLIVYDPRELAKITPRGRVNVAQNPGEVAARAFELFDQGIPLRQIVIELRQTPELIEQLREKWLDMEGADLVISPQAKETLETLFGSFKGVADLLELATQKLAR